MSETRTSSPALAPQNKSTPRSLSVNRHDGSSEPCSESDPRAGVRTRFESEGMITEIASLIGLLLLVALFNILLPPALFIVCVWMPLSVLALIGINPKARNQRVEDRGNS